MAATGAICRSHSAAMAKSTSMMPFFLTIRSQNDADDAMTTSHMSEAQRRAARRPRPRQRRHMVIGWTKLS